MLVDFSQSLNAVKEASSRKMDGLRFFRAISPEFEGIPPGAPDQVAAFRSTASEILSSGGNQCLGGEQEIYDPVAGAFRRIDSIDSEFHVWSINPATGEREIKKSCKPFAKGVDRLYRVTLSSGKSFVSTLAHQILTTCGWMPVGYVSGEQCGSILCLQGTNSDTSPQGFPKDVSRYSKIIAGFLSGYHHEHRLCDEQPHWQEVVSQCDFPQQGDAQACSYHLNSDVQACKSSRTHPSLSFFPLSSRDDPFLTLDRVFSSRTRFSSQPYLQLSGSVQECLQFHATSCLQPRTSDASSRLAIQSDAVSYVVDFDSSCSFLKPQNTTALITSCEYIRTDKFYDITVEDNENYELAGILHHNSGKSTWCAARFASIARGVPVTFYDGTVFDPRLEWQRNRPLVMWCIGLQVNHLSTMYSMLFRPGLFKIIKDRKTSEWRIWMPWYEDDADRFMDVKPSPPLIPRWEVATETFYKKAARQFEMVVLNNGTEIWGLPSSSDHPKMGDKVDEIWIDERIASAEHYPEWQMRKVANRGRILRSGYADTSDESLVFLQERSVDQREQLENGERETVDAEWFQYTYSGNPFIHPDEKRKTIEGMTDDELAVRDRGEFRHTESKIYPFFSRIVHAAIPFNERDDDEIASILRKNNGQPPSHWTHELIIDPGTTKPGLLLGAIPPPELWGGKEAIKIAYREVYKPTRLENAKVLAEEIRKNVPYDILFARWIIDMQSGQRRPESFGVRIMDNYYEHFVKAGLECANNRFEAGMNNFTICQQMVNQEMTTEQNGKPKLRIVIENCPHLVHQMETNRLQTVNGVITDKENIREKNDMRKCLEYWISKKPTYISMKGYTQSTGDGYDEAILAAYGPPPKKSQGSILIGPPA